MPEVMRIARKYTNMDPDSRRRDRKSPRLVVSEVREWVSTHLSGEVQIVDKISRPKIIASEGDLTLFKIRFP